MGLFLLMWLYDKWGEYSLLETAEDYSVSSELLQMRRTFDGWKHNRAAVRRFTDLVKEHRKTPALHSNANPDVVQIQAPKR